MIFRYLAALNVATAIAVMPFAMVVNPNEMIIYIIVHSAIITKKKIKGVNMLNADGISIMDVVPLERSKLPFSENISVIITISCGVPEGRHHVIIDGAVGYTSTSFPMATWAMAVRNRILRQSRKIFFLYNFWKLS